MKKIMFLCGLFVILALSSLYADGPMFNQPYDTTSPNLYTSTYDSTFPIDYRVADNFNGLTKPISKIVFYGSPIIYGGGAWTPSTFAATESFTIRFYNFVDLGTEPAWAAPVASYIVTATATYLENVTWAAYGIYKFEANLPAPFDLASGWISVQLNELTSSGAWYLTVESATGDDVSYQYEGAKSNSETAGVHSPALDSPKAVLASDMAFELYGADESIIIDGITAPPVGVTVIPGGESGMPGTDGGMAAVVYTITTTGVWDVIVHRPAGYPLPWYAYLNTVPMLESGPIMNDTFTFNDVDFGLVKGPIIVTLDDDEDLTLPVTLSSFTANLTAQNYVKLTWVSESETNLLGYKVYRNDSLDLASALLITPTMIGATNTSSSATYSTIDDEVIIGNTYYYWLESIDMGSTTFHDPISVTLEGEIPPVIPTTTSMSNAYPHPFKVSEGTNIDVNIKAGETGTVTIYNVVGQTVQTYSLNEGSHKLNWNGRDSNNRVCANGIYFYKLSTATMNQTRKMVIVK